MSGIQAPGTGLRYWENKALAIDEVMTATFNIDARDVGEARLTIWFSGLDLLHALHNLCHNISYPICEYLNFDLGPIF